MNNKGFFITGTDTGVGKTIVSGALIRAIIHMGLPVGAMKPVETGCARGSNGVLIPTDGAFLMEMAGMDTATLSEVTPCRYETALSPLSASEIEERPVDLDAIRAGFHALSASHEVMVVEGVGGIKVPITEGYFVSDMAVEMGLPLVIVASPWLGTINHTLLTLSEAQRVGLEVAGIIVNYPSPARGGMDERTNPWMLGRLSKVPLIGVLPYMASCSAPELERAAKGHLDMDMLKGWISL